MICSLYAMCQIFSECKTLKQNILLPQYIVIFSKLWIDRSKDDETISVFGGRNFKLKSAKLQLKTAVFF